MKNKNVTAKSKYVRSSAQKTRLVVDMIRGENAIYASEMLKFVNKKAALPVKKTIDSAIANAVNNENMDRKELTIVEAMVDDAPIFKRGRAVSKGRYHKILKRNCHITIVLSGKQKPDATKKKAEGAKSSKQTAVKKQLDNKVESKETKTKTAKKPKTKKPVVNKDLTKTSQVKKTGSQRKVQAKG